MIEVNWCYFNTLESLLNLSITNHDIESFALVRYAIMAMTERVGFLAELRIPILRAVVFQTAISLPYWLVPCLVQRRGM